MKTLRHRAAIALFGCLALTPLLATQAQIVAAMPDFTITSVTDSGLTAHVTVKNIGTGNAPGCILRAYLWNGVGWQEFKSVNVGPLAVGATTLKLIPHGNMGAFSNKYVIDAPNAVVESKENNNTCYYPEPAG